MRISPSGNLLKKQEEGSKIERVESSKSSVNKTTVIFALTTLLLLAVIGFLVVKPKISVPNISLPSFGKSAEKAIKASGYQAVFLSNGQVYFGKLTGFNGSEPVLKDVYYLKVGTILEPGTAGKQGDVKVEGKTTKEATAAAVPRSTLTLVKLGEEIHGPSDEIKLNKDQILFVENLRDDSKVVDAIKKYQQAQVKK